MALRLRFGVLIPMAAAALLSAAPPARAHPELMAFVQHRARIEAGPRHIDVTLELTFFELRSMAEKRRMDRDRDGRVSAAEADAFRAEIGRIAAESVRLTIDGRAADLVPLYAPELDLMGVFEIAPAHHVLRLFFFARTPDWFVPSSRLVLEEALWPNVPSVDSFTATGAGGVQLVAESEAFGGAPVADVRRWAARYAGKSPRQAVSSGSGVSRAGVVAGVGFVPVALLSAAAMTLFGVAARARFRRRIEKVRKQVPTAVVR